VLDNTGRMAGETPGALRGEIELSVVVPVYGCGDCLAALHARLTASVAQVTERYEFVFVDDRSVDNGWAVLRRLAREDPHVRAFRLSRNFGQDAAITAGLAQARGGWAVVMDCDLQEAPEDIPRLWAAAGEGYDVVRTVRRGWRHSAFRRWASRLYRRLTLETDVRPDYSNLSLLSRRVIDAFLRLRDRDREYMIALDWLGFDSTAIEIEHHERHAGQSGYTLERLVKVALDGMFFRSTVLLKVVVLVGFLVALAGIVLAGFEVVDYFAENDRTVPGYTSLAVLLLLLAGFIIVSVGVVGLYVGRIFEQVKNRPLFLVDAEAEGPEVEGLALEGLEAQGPEGEDRQAEGPETAWRQPQPLPDPHPPAAST
jgi:polyisoprenyl-phosphate glycosyltransferase